MEQRGMLRPTSCDLSPDTNVFKDNESNEDTEPRHCTNLLLAAVNLFGLLFILVLNPLGGFVRLEICEGFPTLHGLVLNPLGWFVRLEISEGSVHFTV